jgi:hypothetical protein
MGTFCETVSAVVGLTVTGVPDHQIASLFGCPLQAPVSRFLVYLCQYCYITQYGGKIWLDAKFFCHSCDCLRYRPRALQQVVFHRFGDLAFVTEAVVMTTDFV